MPSKIKESAELESQLAKSHQELLYSLSHDFGAPLRRIIGFSKLLDDSHRESLNDEGKDFLHFIQTEAHSLQTMLEHTLTLSRVVSAEPEYTPIAGHDLITNVLDYFKIEIAERKATVNIQGEFPYLLAHRPWAEEALLHLVDNALKFHAPNTPPYVEISPYQPTGKDTQPMMGFKISDRGIGVPEPFAKEIFQLFRRAVGADFPGTGAGLKIAQTIAHKSGGQVCYEPNETDHGSSFILTFKRHERAPSCER